ncbi:MAG TPA: hypothetical protein VJ063_16915, partial [Verrucomicrobiae bacterium]|nr:hypothetical protein [Verrucomicrobiae bacterium]
ALGVWFLKKGLQMDERPKPAPIVARAPEPIAGPARVVVVHVTNLVTPSPPPPAYKLQGIYWRPTKPAAVVNGKTVYVGDRVDSARVTAIDQEGVTLLVEGKPKVLSLP